MDTSRIIINTIDNSTSNVEQSTATVGFTVIEAPKGSITPRKILAGGASKIKDIFGEATEEYPELFEVETFNKEYDIYVSAPYSSAKVPVAYLTDKGVFIKKDTVEYTEKLEKYILEGDTSDDIENISRIASQKSNTETKIEITSKEIVEDVINYITKEEKTTKKASVSDIPQVEEYYIVNFKGTEQVMYLYTKSDKYYIEKPYDGIYEITQEEYNNILKYLYLN